MKKYTIKDNKGNKKTIYAEDLNDAIKLVDMGQHAPATIVPAHQTYNPEYSIQQFKSYISNVIKDLYGNEYNSNKVRAISKLNTYVSQVIDDFKADIKNSNLDKKKTVQYYIQYVDALHKELTDVKNIQNIDGQSLKKIDDIHAEMAHSIHDSIYDEDNFFYYDADEDRRSLDDYKHIMQQCGLTITKVKGNSREAYIYYKGSSSAEQKAADKLGISLDDSVKVTDEASLATSINALVTDEKAAIDAYNVAINNLKGKIDDKAMQVLINIMKDERKHVENLYAILNNQVTEKNLEDSIKDVVKDSATKDTDGSIGIIFNKLYNSDYDSFDEVKRDFDRLKSTFSDVEKEKIYKEIAFASGMTISSVKQRLEDSKMKDSYIVKVDNDYIMESGRPEMTSFRKYAKQFNSEKEAIDYAKKYFKIRPSDINVIKE